MNPTTIIALWLAINTGILLLYMLTKIISTKCTPSLKEFASAILQGILILICVLLWGFLVIFYVEVVKIKELFDW